MSATKYVEIEARWINLNQEEMERTLLAIGATLTNEYFFKEWIFQKKEWKDDARRIRVRTDGKHTWVTYKANATWAIDSTEEVEFTASSAEDAVKFLQVSDIPLLRYQEKKRRSYSYDGITFEVDNWPSIPMVLEIEAPSEEKVKEGAALLGLSWDDAIFEDQKVIHEKYFNFDMNDLPDYRFKE